VKRTSDAVSLSGKTNSRSVDEFQLTPRQQPGEISCVSAIESRRGPPEEEHVVPSQHKLHQDMGQRGIGITPGGTSMREQLEYAIKKGKQSNGNLEHTAAEAILVSALDPLRIYIRRDLTWEYWRQLQLLSQGFFTCGLCSSLLPVVARHLLLRQTARPFRTLLKFNLCHPTCY
jgi:hypothetical protein